MATAFRLMAGTATSKKNFDMWGVTLFVPIGETERRRLLAYHLYFVRRRVAWVAAAVAVLTLGTVLGAPAADMRAIPPGFSAEKITSFPEVLCGGDGPTSTVRLNSTAYFAANGKLYSYRPGGGLASQQQDVRPWGLTVVGSNMYASQPQCGAGVVNNPAQGNNCTVVQINPNTARAMREVAPLCAYAITAAPGGSALTVAERNGRVVNVPVAGGASQLLFDLAGNPAVSLAWSSDGKRLFFVRQGREAMVWSGSGAPTALNGAGRVNSLAIGDPVSLRGSVLTAGDPSVPVKAVAVDPGAYAGDVASSSAAAGVLLAAPEGVYVAQATELHLLRGQYSPPAPATTLPPPSVPPTVAPRITPTSLVQAAPPPPPVQAPPPPPPPAPPAPPLATAAQVVAQPSAVANPAIVPGDQEREAAMRLAATGRPRQLAPHLLWLLLAAVVCIGGGGLGLGLSLRRADAGRYAWADND